MDDLEADIFEICGKFRNFSRSSNICYRVLGHYIIMLSLVVTGCHSWHHIFWRMLSVFSSQIQSVVNANLLAFMICQFFYGFEFLFFKRHGSKFQKAYDCFQLRSYEHGKVWIRNKDPETAEEWTLLNRWCYDKVSIYLKYPTEIRISFRGKSSHIIKAIYQKFMAKLWDGCGTWWKKIGCGWVR